MGSGKTSKWRNDACFGGAYCCCIQGKVFLSLPVWERALVFYMYTLRPLIVGGLIKKRGLAIFPEEINGEGVNKWKWVDFVM